MGRASLERSASLSSAAGTEVQFRKHDAFLVVATRCEAKDDEVLALIGDFRDLTLLEFARA